MAHHAVTLIRERGADLALLASTKGQRGRKRAALGRVDGARSSPVSPMARSSQENSGSRTGIESISALRVRDASDLDHLLRHSSTMRPRYADADAVRHVLHDR